MSAAVYYAATEIASSSPESGLQRALAKTVPPPAELAGELPRLCRRSSVDLTEDTVASTLIEQLARLSDPCSIPQLSRPTAVLVGEDALVASLVDANITIEAILRTSPLSQDKTLGILARLVAKAIIRLNRREGTQ